MPYLADKQRRDQLESCGAPDDGAELNYIISRMVDFYVERHGLNYHVLEEIVGALESAKAEFQRRVVGPYEKLKLQENGEVFRFCAQQIAARKALTSGTGKHSANIVSGL